MVALAIDLTPIWRLRRVDDGLSAWWRAYHHDVATTPWIGRDVRASGLSRPVRATTVGRSLRPLRVEPVPGLSEVAFGVEP